MNENVKKLWTDALRSGDYVQGKKALRNDDNTYCCLGVLCDLYQKQRGNGYWQETSNGFYGFMVEGERSSAYLPGPVRKWAGLDSGSPLIESMGYRLDHLNDNGMSFENVANLIENEL